MMNLKAPEESIILRPRMTVLGVGGAGCNAINNMIAALLQGVHFAVANTDAQALEHSTAERKIQLGASTTRGLGAGAAREIGRAAAEESRDEIVSCLEGSNMVFITAGMGGGTGTGAAPVIASIAKEMGILTVGVVTKPFHFEGAHRMKTADAGLVDLQQHVDTLIVIPNQNLFRIANEKTTFVEAFKTADEVLRKGVQSITDLMIMPGLINLDFADISAVMSKMGKAMMGTGEATGDDRAVRAAEMAIQNPLLDQSSMNGARGVLINITGGDMTLMEVDAAANRIREEVANNDANIIFGSTFDEALEGVIRVSVVATGIDSHNVNSHTLKSTHAPTTRSFTDTTPLMQAKQKEDAPVASSNDEAYDAQGAIQSFDEYDIANDISTNKVDSLLCAEQEETRAYKNHVDRHQIDTDISVSSAYNNAHQKYHTKTQRQNRSMFGRLWDSIRGAEERYQEQEDVHSVKRNESEMYKSEASEIYDIPTFLRKKGK